jgi:outer membrane murein-binding lipoprotein Lpp
VLDKLDALDEKLEIVTVQHAKDITEAKASAERAHERIDTMTGT